MKDYYLNLIPTGKHEPKKVVELTCERCKKKFTIESWLAKKGRRFCTQKCRKADPLETMLSRIEKDENGCWNWTGTIGWGGYGQIKVGKTCHSTHKLMWILWNKKPVPHGMVVRHTCIGNRRCMNPDHLILGTQKENIRDCISQGRFRGSNSELTEDQINYILSARNPNDGSKPPTYKKLGLELGIPRYVVWWTANKRRRC